MPHMDPTAAEPSRVKTSACADENTATTSPTKSESVLNGASTKNENKSFSSWIEETRRQLELDGRSQPWKATFGEAADRGFSGNDEIIVREEDGVQHSSVAA